MTETAKKIIAAFEKELEELPEDEQEEYAASYLEDLRRRKQAKTKGKTAKHPSLVILQEARLKGLPSNYSERLDHCLYGVGEE